MTDPQSAVAAETRAGDELLAEIRRVNGEFRSLERHGGDADALLVAKLDTAYWRRSMAQTVIGEAEAGRLSENDLARALLDLGLALDPEDRARVESILEDRDLLGRVFAQQAVRVPDAPQHHRVAGPETQLDIKVNRASPWPFERWREIEDLGEYEYVDDGVLYRGIHFLPGDAIFPNVNLDGNIVFSALSDPHALYSHSAVFTVLDHAGRRFPAVVETFEKGLRAVPLCVFFNDRYSSYAEVYRHRRLTAEHRKGVSDFVLEAMGRVRGYNFQSAEADELEYVACTMFVRWVYEDAGLGPVPAESGVGHPRILSNLEMVDYVGLDPFFTPVDFIRNPDFEYVGIVDNNKFDRLLTRELIQARFRDMYSSMVMNPRHFPRMYKPNLWGVRQIRKGRAVGKLISKFLGWPAENIPKGPDKLIAAIGLAEHQLTKITQKMVPIVADRVRELGRFDFEETLADSVISGALDRHMRFRWLEPAPPDA